MSRVIIESIIERARDVRRVDTPDRAILQAALLDITLDIALQMATKTNGVVHQIYVDPKAKLRAVRKLQTDWRAVVKGVRAFYDDHPISDRHMKATLMAYYPSLVDQVTVFSDVLFTGQELSNLRYSSKATARKAVREVLTNYFR